jgi:MFS family permease
MEADKQKGFRNVIILSIVSFLNDLSSEMIMPILPMFLQSLGATGEIIGLVGGLRESISSILKVVCGYWSDKTGKRKAFVYAGYATSTVFKLLLALSRVWPSAVVFSSLERVGKGLRTAARDAIIAESVTTQRGRAFGVHRGIETGGAILGAVAAFLLFWFLGMKFGSIILVAAITGVASLIPLYFVRETGSEQPQNITLKLGMRALPAPLRLFIVIAGIFALGEYSYMFFVMRAQHFFEGRLSVAAPILLYVLFNIFYSALAVPFGIISDKIGREKVIILGYLVFSMTSVGFIFADSPWIFVVLFATYGVMFAAIDGNQRAFVSDLAGANLKATALGMFHTVTGIAALPAGLAAGFLWENVSPSATFAYGGILGLSAVGLFILFRRRFERMDARGGKGSVE